MQKITLTAVLLLTALPAPVLQAQAVPDEETTETISGRRSRRQRQTGLTR